LPGRQANGPGVPGGTQRRSEFKSLFLKLVAFVRSGRLGKNLTVTATTNPGERGGPFPGADPPPQLDWISG